MNWQWIDCVVLAAVVLVAMWVGTVTFSAIEFLRHYNDSPDDDEDEWG